MIVEAIDFNARFDAVQFDFGAARPDLDQERLDDIALTYALNAPFTAIEEEDYALQLSHESKKGDPKAAQSGFF